MIWFTVLLGILVMLPWVLLMFMLSLKYIFKKPVTRQWKTFLITLAVCYSLLVCLTIGVYFLGNAGVFGEAKK